jgi:hypothetical protein
MRDVFNTVKEVQVFSDRVEIIYYPESLKKIITRFTGVFAKI